MLSFNSLVQQQSINTTYVMMGIDISKTRNQPCPRINCFNFQNIHQILGIYKKKACQSLTNKSNFPNIIIVHPYENVQLPTKSHILDILLGIAQHNVMKLRSIISMAHLIITPSQDYIIEYR